MLSIGLFLMMFRLDKKVAIVTGAARGIGSAVARVLARQGAKVAAADIRADELTPLKKELGEAAYPYQLDVADTEQLRVFVQHVVQDLGRIDILVNNAGICPRLPFSESTETDWEQLMAVNARSQYFLMQAVCPVMKEQGGGRIVNIASTSGRIGATANASAYSGTKGAIVMFSKSIAREVAADGILVNCVAPGMIDTELMQNLPSDKLQAFCDQVPLRRLGRPDEVANVVAFLASDECSYVTGATIDITGGWVML